MAGTNLTETRKATLNAFDPDAAKAVRLQHPTVIFHRARNAAAPASPSSGEAFQAVVLKTSMAERKYQNLREGIIAETQRNFAKPSSRAKAIFSDACNRPAFGFAAMQCGSRCGFSAPVKNEACAITTDGVFLAHAYCVAQSVKIRPSLKEVGPWANAAPSRDGCIFTFIND
jgi:hypothetical protein